MVKYMEQGSIDEIYGTRFNRVKDPNSADFGKIILNADGLPTRDPEIVRLGNQQAKALFGVTNTFGYKGFGFSFQVRIWFFIPGRCKVWWPNILGYTSSHAGSRYRSRNCTGR